MAEILSEFGHLVGLVGGNNIQATTMPTYSSVPLGTIVQYIGTTTADYINGYFYKATASGWEQHDTQPASNADNSITAFKESSPALAAHAVDDYIRYNNATYIVTAAIAIGDNLVVGTNIAVPVLDEGTVIYTPEAGGGSAGGGHVIVNPSGTDMEQRASLQFVDANVTDDSTNDKTKIENVKVINSESELTNASDGMYMGSYDDEPEGVLSADMVMYDSETTVEDELDNKVDKVTGKGLSTNDYDNTDKAKVGKIDDTTTAVTGNPISITGLKSNQLAINPIITLEPIQAGSGDPSPSNVRAISGYDKIEVLSLRKNLLNYDAWKGCHVVSGTAIYENNGVTLTATSNDCYTDYIYYPEEAYIYVKTGDIVTLSWDIIGTINNGNVFIFGNAGTSSMVQTPASSKTLSYIVPEGVTFIAFRVGVGSAGDTIAYSNIQIELGSTATTYEPYNPITNIQLTLGQTIYGGTLDVEKGILTVDRGYISANNTILEYVSEPNICVIARNISNVNPDDFVAYNMISNAFQVYAANPLYTDTSIQGITIDPSGNVYFRLTSASSQSDYETFLTNNPVQVCYALATPYTIQLTPHEISLLKDCAYVTTNGTSMNFSYHNGEIATLGDVDQLGQTVNELGYNVSADNSAIDAIVNVYGGKNLFPDFVESQTYKGITWTRNADSSITVNGTSSGWSVIKYNGSIKLKAGTYILSSGLIWPDCYDVYAEFAYNDGTDHVINTAYADEVTFTLTNDTEIPSIQVVVRSNTTVSNITIKPMIRDARISDSTYVPYSKTNQELTTKTNSIDAIVNVYGSKNLLPMTVDNIKKANESYGYTWNGNSTTVHGITFTILTDSDNIVTGIQANGTATDNIAFLIQDRINAFDLANGTYKISKGNTVAGRNIIVDAYNNMTWVKSIINTNLDNVDFTIDHVEYDKIVVYLLINNGQSLNNLIFYPMIRDARISDSTYVPYSRTNQELTGDVDATMNLLGAKNIYPGLNQDSANRLNTIGPNNRFTVNASTAYTFSCNYSGNKATQYRIYFYNSAGTNTYASGWTTFDKIFNFTTAFDTCTIALRIRFGDDTAILVSDIPNPMVRPSSTNSTYVPYAMTNRELTEKKADNIERVGGIPTQENGTTIITFSGSAVCRVPHFMLLLGGQSGCSSPIIVGFIGQYGTATIEGIFVSDTLNGLIQISGTSIIITDGFGGWGDGFIFNLLPQDNVTFTVTRGT